MITQKAELIQAALEYARRGWRVFPCRPGDKRPMKGFRWRNEATIDEETIKRWWKRWPDANIGLATGGGGVVVLDVDGEEGERSLQELEEAYGPLPRTLEARTGGGGRHIFFKAPDWYVPISVSKIGTNLDIRGDGGYVVAPPSIHKSGKRYEWITTSEPAELPDWLAALIRKKTRQYTEKARQEVTGKVWEDYLEGPPIHKGERDERLFKIGCSMRANGAGYQDILATLLRINAERCVPSLPVPQVEQKAAQAIKYPPRKTGLLSHPDTDWGNAERLVERHGADIKYCAKLKGWHVWDGFRWVLDESGEILRRAADTVRAYHEEAAAALAEKKKQIRLVEDLAGEAAALKKELDELKAQARFAKQSENKARLSAMVELAASQAGVAIADPDKFDANPWLLNVENGTIDLREHRLLPHRREDLLTKIAPVAYDPNAECPRWERFVHEIMGGDEELVRYLQKAIGYSLTGSTREQIWFLLYGSGANGKSVFLNTIQELLGDYAQQASSSLMLSRREEGGAPSSDIAGVRGARFVCVIETEEGRRMAENVVKQLTGGDPIKARFLYKDEFEFKPICKLWMATNHKPVVRGTDYGFWRRVRMIPFTVQIPPEKRDKDLPDKLRKEFPGILRWALEGLRMYQEEGLGLPAKVEAATQEYKEEMDGLGAFLTECCDTSDPLVKTGVRELYRAYTNWCYENGETPMKQRMLGKRLKERGFQQDRLNDGRFAWLGIKLLPGAKEFV